MFRKISVLFLVLLSLTYVVASAGSLKGSSVIIGASTAAPKRLSPRDIAQAKKLADIKAKNAHPVLKFVDRNDYSNSKGNLVFLLMRAIWGVAISQLYFNGHPLLNKFTSLLGIKHTPDVARLTALGAAAAFTAFRQVFWTLYLRSYDFRMPAALMIGIGVPQFFNVVTLLSVAFNKAAFGGWQDKVGLGLFVFGGLLETFSEIQRKHFKSQPANKGKLYTGGLFSLARHINYTGEIFWYTGLLLLATGNPWVAAAVFVGQTNFFNRVGVSEIAVHMETKYSKLWEEYKRKTPYALIPLVV